jgi:hypothetical protein
MWLIVFMARDLLVDSFATTILSGFPRPFYPYQGVLEQAQITRNKKLYLRIFSVFIEVKKRT